MFGGDEKAEEKTPQVAFTGRVRAESEAKRPGQAEADAEAKPIFTMLNDWYQTAFIDPKLFGDGTFPDVAKLFAKEAQASFTKDISSLTIGEAREQVRRVVPEQSIANITLFYDDGGNAVFATAAVRFMARATLTQDGAFPLRITQTGTYHLKREGSSWLVTFYDASANQDSIQPTPSPSR